MPAKIALVSNTAWYIYNFRRALIAELQRHGYAVVAVAPQDEYAEHLTALGVSFRALPMDNKGTNPLRDLRLLIALLRLFRQERPCCVLTFTVKPNVFGTFAADWLGIPAISNVSGLGTVFIKRTWVTRVVRSLYRSALRRASTVFFQNPEDLQLFIQERLVIPDNARLLPGSGVDIGRFAPQSAARQPGKAFRFLLLGRLLWDKGVGEFVEAAAQLKRAFPNCEFVLMGFTGTDNRTAISAAQIREWASGGLVEYVAPTADVRAQLAQADCVVLPSYREGTPKALLEASSMGIPILATDVPGCRQVVEDGVTGFLVKARDAGDLAQKMVRMLQLPDNERESMGTRGREKMAREFDERFVIERYMKAIGEVTGQSQDPKS